VLENQVVGSEESTQELGFSLSYQQRRLWQLMRSGVDSAISTGAFHGQCTLRLAGPLETDRLRGALREIIDSHDILRTMFQIPFGQRLAVQVVKQRGEFSWYEIDLRSCASDEQPSQIEACQRNDFDQPFNLSEGPLVRASLLAVRDNQYLLVLTLPSICADASTLRNIAYELSQCYAKDIRVDQTGDVLQYIQLAEWQQAIQEEDSAQEGKRFWNIKRGSPPLVLPLERSPHEPAAFLPLSHSLPLTIAAADKLSEIERKDVFLLGCWLSLLSRISGQSFVNSGFTCQGRSYEEVQSAMGPLARSIPVGCSIQAGQRFSDLLDTVTKAVDLADDWQEFYVRSDDEEPFEPAGYEYIQWPSKAESTVLCKLASQRSCSDRFHIKLSVTDVGDRLLVWLEWDPLVLTAEYVARLAEQLGTLIGSALDNHDVTIGQLSILGDDERRFVLQECNASTADYPNDSCLHELFAEQTTRTPDRIAIICENSSLTYNELNRRANQLAHHLRGLGVGPEVRVGILMHRSIEMMIGLLGVLKAGGAYVPLDPAYPAERLAFMLTDSQVSVLLTEQRLRSRLPHTDETQVLCLDRALREIVEPNPDSVPQSGVRATNLVYALYTSGSTGRPKGTLITHRGLVNYLSWCCAAYDVESGVGTALHSSLGFDATITDLFPPLMVGRSVTLLPEMDGVEALREAMQRSDGFSLVKITPAHLSLLNEFITDGAWASRTRALVIGGDALVPARLAPWRQHASQTRLINEYGPTETVVGCSIHELANSDKTEESVPIGRPIANAQLYVMDSELSPQPTGVAGELFIGGDGVARGYLGRPGITAERFLPDHLSGGQGCRLYRTGDLVLRDATGALSFLGRLDHQVKIRSYRIELGEIEAQLELHTDVAQSVVVAFDQDSGEKALVAYIQPSGPKAPAREELRSFLFGKLPEYMVPAVFVTVEAFPLTAHGKVDRGALPRPVVEAAEGGSYVAPRTLAEKTLAGVWCSVLSLEKVGIHDDFFRSGGDSILSILVVARATKAGLRFTTRDLFQHPTIAELATIAASTPNTVPAQVRIDGEVPLTPIQHWFFEHNLQAPNHFNQAVFLDMSTEVRFDLLRRALEQLVEHHDALRLRFVQEPSGWRQTHSNAEGTAVICEVDLTGIPEFDRHENLMELGNEAQAGLDISRGPLLRAILFRVGSGVPSRLLLVVHHLVVDGVSWRILLDDLANAYQQLVRGESVQLPAKTTAFKDWSARLKRYACSEKLTAEADHWMQQPIEAASLPVDFVSRPEANTVASAAKIRIALDRNATDALLYEVPDVYRTRVDDLLLTALVQAFERWTSTPSLLIDLEGHGREDLFPEFDLSRTVGWFTSISPIHLRLEGPSQGDALKAIKEQLRRIPQRGIGYGVLRYLSPQANTRALLEALPKAQVSFNNLGRIDGLSAGPILGVVNEGAGSGESSTAPRRYLLEVITQIENGCLQMDIVYSTVIHRKTTIEDLVALVLTKIKSLLEHCLSLGAGGFTPSDFPAAGLTQEEIDRLVGDLE